MCWFSKCHMSLVSPLPISLSTHFDVAVQIGMPHTIDQDSLYVLMTTIVKTIKLPLHWKGKAQCHVYSPQSAIFAICRIRVYASAIVFPIM